MARASASADDPRIRSAAALLAKASAWTPALQASLERILSPAPSDLLLSQVLLHPLTPSPLACHLYLSRPSTSFSLCEALCASLTRPSHLHSFLPALHCLAASRNPQIALHHFCAHLISSLALAGLPLYAKHVFVAMPLLCCPPDLLACNALLQALLSPKSSLTPSASSCQALALFEQMPAMGLQPDVVTYRTLFCGLFTVGHKEQALQVLSLMLDMEGVDLPPASTYNVLIKLLVEQGKVDKAVQLFKIMPVTCPANIFITVMNGLLKASDSSKALLLLDEMQRRACSADADIFGTCIDWLVKQDELEKAFQLFEAMPAAGFSPNSVTYNALVYGLFKANNISKALLLLGEMEERRHSPSTFMFIPLIEWFFKKGEVEAAMGLLHHMQSLGCCKPGCITHTTLICGLLKANEGSLALLLLRGLDYNGYRPEVAAFSAMMYWLVKEGYGEAAVHMLKNMPSMSAGPGATVTSYTTLIDGLLEAEEAALAASGLIEAAEQGCRLDTMTCTAIMHLSFKQGQVEGALGLIQKMRSIGCKPDVVTYTALLDGLLEANEDKLAFLVLSQMGREGCNPGTETCMVIIKHLVKKRKVNAALRLLQTMPIMGCQPDKRTYTTLLDGLSAENGFNEGFQSFLKG